MKIAVILATRGKPKRALGVIEAMRVMQSGENEVRVILACDDDDPADTAGFFSAYGDPQITIACAPRPAGASACWNRCVRLTDAEVLMTMTDDALIVTPNWDAGIAHIFTHHQWPHPEIAMSALQETANPGQGTLFVFRPSWFKHCGLFDERFPAWFSDTAICETYSFLTGDMIPFLPVHAALKPGEYNPRLREMKLWWTLYAVTRLERLETARRTRSALGLPEPPNLEEIVSLWQQRDVRGLPDSEHIVAHCIPNPKAPDEAYNRARVAALDLIRQFPDAAKHLSGDLTGEAFALAA